jgi:O-antigen/teichoic acid export membrane protein
MSREEGPEAAPAHRPGLAGRPAATPTAALRPRLRQAGAYTLAMYTARVGVMVKNMLLALLLGPTEFGLVAAFLTFLGYSIYLDFGLLHAVYREIPMLRGAGRERRAMRVVAAAYGGITLLGGSAAAVLLLVAGLEGAGVLPGPWWFATSLAGALLAQQLAYLPYNVALADGEFGILALGVSGAAVVDVAGSVAAGFAWGPAGAVAVASAGFVVQYLVILKRLRPRPRPSWDPREAVRLAAIGIPIALIWFGNMNFISMDKLVALVALGQTSVGLYTLASAVSSLTMVGPVAVATQFGPRILKGLGESADGAEVSRTTTVALDAAALAAAPIVAVAIVALPAVTHAVLPKYLDAVRSAQILVSGGALLASTIPIVTYTIGRKKQWTVIALYLATAVFNLALDVVLLTLGWGIEGIAIGSLTSYFVFAIVMRKLLATLDQRQVLPRLLVSLLPILWGTAVGAAGAALLYGQNLERSVVAAAALAAVSLALVAPVAVAYLRLAGSRSLGRSVTP